MSKTKFRAPGIDTDEALKVVWRTYYNRLEKGPFEFDATFLDLSTT